MSVSVAKNYVAVVVDVSAATGSSSEDRKTQLLSTLDAAKSVLKFKSMFSPKNSVLIVCVGTKGTVQATHCASNYSSNAAYLPETNNDLSDEDGYNHISVVKPLSFVDGTSFDAIEPSRVLADPQAGDVLSGVVVALELLKGAEKPPGGRMPPKELIVISDGATPVDDSPDAIVSIAGQLKSNKISTNLMCVSVPHAPPHVTSSPLPTQRHEFLRGNREPHGCSIRLAGFEHGV